MLASLGVATRRALKELMARGQVELQSDHARRYFGIGQEMDRGEVRRVGH